MTTIPASIANKVAEIYRDEDGWWVVLADGWTIDGCTGWREDTKAKLLARVREAKFAL